MVEIIIRQAAARDVKEIWELMRSEYEMWNEEKILSHLAHLFVIIYMGKIVGVLHGTFAPDSQSIDWVAVHPMYPQSSVSLALICGLWGVMCRKPFDNLVFKDTELDNFKNRIKEGWDKFSRMNVLEGV